MDTGPDSGAPHPPAYLLRDQDPTNEESPIEGDQAVMPAVMALIDASEASDPPENLSLVLEALLFSTEEPPTVSQLAQATQAPRDAIEQALDGLAEVANQRGLRLQRTGNTVRLVSAPEAAPYIRRLLGLERPNKLSKAALETLAIIAYQQPITRGAVERVRGVTCDAPLATLRLRELIASVGQAETPGRPHLWATTPAFLNHFGLSDVRELPSLPRLAAPVAQGALDLETGPDEDASVDSDNMGAAADPPESTPAPTAIASAHAPESDLGGLAAAGGD